MDDPTPTPSLTYSWLNRPGTEIVVEGPTIHTVFEVSAGSHNGEICVWVRGRMLKKDGTPGPSRGSQVVIDAGQPAWLAGIIADVRRRYYTEGSR